MYVHKNCELHKFATTNSNLEQALTLSDILAESEVNRLDRLRFRTIDRSFFPLRTDGRTDRHHGDDISYFFKEKKTT